jgi:hypothetical protein
MSYPTIFGRINAESVDATIFDILLLQTSNAWAAIICADNNLLVCSDSILCANPIFLPDKNSPTNTRTRKHSVTSRVRIPDADTRLRVWSSN